MNEELLALCRRAPNVGTVKHEDFTAYVVVLKAQRQVDGEWQTVEYAYMTVDGKLAMANEDHRRQGKRLDFAEPKVLRDTPEELTLLVTVTSEIYGTRHGIATSRKKGGTNAERDFPWEVAETSAIGRALAAMGYGLLPGAGLASAEDMLRVAGKPEGKPAQSPRSAADLAARADRLRAKVVMHYCAQHGVDTPQAQSALDALFREQFGHPLTEATVPEMSKVINQILSSRRNGNGGQA